MPARPVDAATPTRTPRSLPTTFLTSMALRFGTVAVNAVTGIVTARALDPSGRGELAAMVLWPMLFAGLTTCGLPAALVYYMRSEPRQAGAFVGWALLLSTLSALAGTAIGWQLIPIWLSHHPPEVIRGAQFCLLTTLLCALTLTARAGWEARGEFVRSSLSQVVTPLCALAALGLLSWRGALTPTSAAAAYVLAGLPSLFWIVTALAEARPPDTRRRPGAVGPPVALRAALVRRRPVRHPRRLPGSGAGRRPAQRGLDGHLRRGAEPVAGDHRRARLRGDDRLPARGRPRPRGDGGGGGPLRADGDAGVRAPSAWRSWPPDRPC